MRPNNGKLDRTHDLPKIHKEYSNAPKVRTIVDTRGTPHYSVCKFLTNLFDLRSMNENTLKDSFDAVNEMKLYNLICLTMDTTMYLLI